MKLICTTSTVSWFTVGREYNNDQDWVCDNDGDEWAVRSYGNCYRTEFLEDAEFAIAPEPVTAADAALFNEALLAAVVQMADEEGCRDSFDRHLATIRHRFGLLKNPQSQRAFLLALAYFAEEQSQ